ncbi:MAG TPA: hypothetical protein VM452_11645 [Caulifigura sp.]|nr:hypothetical protein [Caulifigura sp.]
MSWSIGQGIAVAITALVGLEVWSGVAVIFSPPPHRRLLSRGRVHMVHRDEHELAFWMAIALHVAIVAVLWWTVSSDRPAAFIQPWSEFETR